MKLVFDMDKAAYRLGGICALVVTALSILALLSWGLRQWHLVAFGVDYIPMAPSTALAMFLANSAILRRGRRPDKLATSWWSLFVVMAVALLGLLVLLQEPFGFELGIERWLSRTRETVREIPVGRMSPLTAATFLLVAGALLVRLPQLHHIRSLVHAGNLLALLVSLIGLFVVLGYITGTPLLYDGRTIPVALLTAVSFLLTGMALLGDGVGLWMELLEANGWLIAAPGTRPRLDRRLVSAFLVLVAAIGTAGFFYLRVQQTHARRIMHDELAAIADLKVGQINNWRNERFGDAQLIRNTPFLVETLQRFLEDPSAQKEREPLLQWMAALRGQHGYSRVLLFDRDGRMRLAAPDTAAGTEPLIAQEASEALRTNRIVALDLNRSSTSQRIRMGWLVPLQAPGTSPAAAPAPSIAVILLEVDPHQFLYPLVQSWPAPSRTAETLLVRREGDDVVFLTEVRHRADTALNLRFPVSEPHLPAAMAVRGHRDVLEGLDYRNVPVLTAFRAVPDSPWFLVAKMDQAEIYAPLRNHAIAVGTIVFVLLMAVALGLTLVWRQRDAAFLRRELVLERERTELAERFAHLMRHANDIILLTDSQWRILEANDRALESYGYSPEELHQMALPDLRAPEARAEFPHQIEQLQSEDRTVFETIHQHKDGNVFPVEVSARIVEIGGTIYKLAILRDITQRQEHEREIERLNRLYATLSQVNQAVVRAGSREELLDHVCRIAIEFGGFKLAWIGWLDAETREFTPVACAGAPQDFVGMVGHKMEDWAQKDCLCGVAVREGRYCLVNDFEAAPEMQPWRNEFKKAGVQAAAAFPIRLGGSVRGALTVYAAEPGVFQEKEVGLLEEVVLDISFGLDRQESHTQLHQTLDRLTTLVHTSPLPIILMDTAGGVTLWNPAAERIFGWTEAEVLGRDNPIVPPDKADEVLGVHARVLAGETFEHYETMRRRKDGTLIHVSFSAAALRDQQFNPVGLMAIIEDITERKRTEEEVLKLNEELERRVIERTARLDELNKELEAFSYSVSHDLRAPLRHIGGYVNLLVDRCRNELSDKGRHYLDSIADSAHQMGMLIDDLLKFSRTGRMEMNQSIMGMNQALQDVLLPLQQEHSARNIEWMIETLPDVYGDYSMLRLVWMNLLGNAVKYTRGREKAVIDIGSREEADEIVFYVRDNGVGFDMKYAHKLFGVFQRLHSTEDFEGTGIGLANVRRIIVRHGGRTWAESEVDKGATFYFTIPKTRPPSLDGRGLGGG